MKININNSLAEVLDTALINFEEADGDEQVDMFLDMVENLYWRMKSSQGK